MEVNDNNDVTVNVTYHQKSGFSLVKLASLQMLHLVANPCRRAKRKVLIKHNMYCLRTANESPGPSDTLENYVINACFSYEIK